MTRPVPRFLRHNGRSVIVAIDHALYSWPCKGLEDRASIIARACAGGADGIIASYGTIRDFRETFAGADPILKLDITSLTLGSSYPLTEYLMAYTLENARRLGVTSVLNYVQLGAPFELEALRQSARLAALCDREGFSYLCEIMPVESAMFPDPEAPEAIIAACRTGAELGAHAIKTTMPVPSAAIAPACAACNIPVILAGGAPASQQLLMTSVRTAIESGAAGVAFGRNVWGREDPEAMVRDLVAAVHGPEGG